MTEARRTPLPVLLVRQVRYQVRTFRRNPVAAFFTFFFPLIFLVLFDALQGNHHVTFAGQTVAFSQFFTPAIAVFALVTSCYTNLVMTTSMARDEGILKRVRGTPLPAWVYMAGRVGATVWVGLVSVAIMFVVGVAAYGVRLYAHTLPAAIVTLLVGAGTFAALGLAVTGLVPNSEAAPAIANFTILPLTFVSGVFFPVNSGPTWLQDFGKVFPLEHFVNAFGYAFTPGVVGAGFQGQDLLVMAVWGVAGMVVASRFFTWEPRAVGGRRARGAARGRRHGRAGTAAARSED